MIRPSTSPARSAWALVAAALVVACRDDPPAPGIASPTPSDVPSGTSEFPPDPSEEANAPRGPVASASPKDREAAVLSLLRGESAASELPVVATDDGTEVDPSLRDVIAPRVPGEMRVGAITGDGVVAPEVVGRIVRAADGALLACYHRGLSRNPNLMGRVGAKLRVRAAGAVEEASNGGSNLPDSGVVECVIKVMSTMSFPTSSSEHTIIVPMLLQPAET